MQHFYSRWMTTAILLVSITAWKSVYAQDTTRIWTRPNVLKTNLLAPISLFYERALTRRFALRTSVRWWSFGSVTKDSKFANATIEGKFYTAKTGLLLTRGHPTGFFVGLYLKARTLRYVNEVGTGPGNPMALDEIKVQSIGFGVTIGYVWVARRGFVVELAHGMGSMPAALTSYEHTMRYSTVTSDSGRDYLMLDFRTGVSLGYAF
ncbi:DUF3575 domain-containing protein [Spirosoma validum]|uniref:DUF3575 domain-containing protein n=1 Tax=Spirosoma validum TaxID=2771355 RepID=A0A927GCB0_9BACT|nr:DUF3575 domain-containing protein [Spirosoma validum]MBD2752335.1 DUF3575 domain-containing protein [Spirosoma validum]